MKKLEKVINAMYTIKCSNYAENTKEYQKLKKDVFNAISKFAKANGLKAENKLFDLNTFDFSVGGVIVNQYGDVY